MEFKKKIKEAIFLKRINRFEAYINLDGEEILIHVPNTGRCKELLIPQAKIIIREELNPNRKTKYDLISVYKQDRLINIDSQMPNKIVEEALKNKKIEKLIKYNNILREKTFGNSRFDFKLMNDLGDIYYLEVKGVTLEVDNIAKFPDAPTLRGKKHVLELIEIKKQNIGAGILFLIQIDNIKCFLPNVERDKAFSDALKLAKSNGVDIFAYTCDVKSNSVTLKEPVDIFI